MHAPWCCARFALAAPQGTRAILPREKRLFWLALMLMFAHWVLAIVIAFFGLSKYILVAIIGLLFTSGNAFGYFKCSREAQAEVRCGAARRHARAWPCLAKWAQMGPEWHGWVRVACGCGQMCMRAKQRLRRPRMGL